MIQYARAFFFENGLCMLQLSVLVENVAQHLWTQYRLCDFVWCFVLLHAFLQLFCMTH